MPPLCWNFWEKCKNCLKIGLGCSTSLIHIHCWFHNFFGDTAVNNIPDGQCTIIQDCIIIQHISHETSYESAMWNHFIWINKTMMYDMPLLWLYNLIIVLWCHENQGTSPTSPTLQSCKTRVAYKFGHITRGILCVVKWKSTMNTNEYVFLHRDSTIQ